MPPALRAYWQGTLTHGAPHTEDLRESQEVLSEARNELRSERLALVENWIREFELAEERDPWKVDLSGAERDEFVAMLNDRRMLLATNSASPRRTWKPTYPASPTRLAARPSSKSMCWAISSS